MKKLLLVVLGVVLMNSAFADAKLRVNISGATAGNRYFLCVGNNGCVSITAGDRGQVYPLTTDDGVDHIYATDIATLRMSDQALPKSCQVNVKDNQTLTVSGRIVVEGNGNNTGVRIAGLNCHVA